MLLASSRPARAGSRREDASGRESSRAKSRASFASGPAELTISKPARRSGQDNRKRRRTTRVRRTEPQKFQVTHPFHPLAGREFEALARKEYGGEHRVSFLDKKGRQCEIPLNWTDLAPEDAFTTLSAGKSWFRAADLLELAQLIESLRR
jgi:hypothetical protein